MAVKISFEVEPELRRRVKMAAVSRDQSVKDWIHQAILRELDRECEASTSRTGAPAFDRDRDGKDDDGYDEQEYYPSEGGKPQGSKNPPRPRSGRTVAEAVIEDRR